MMKPHRPSCRTNVLQQLASENMNLFLHCFTRGHGTLQVVALQCITDVLIAHPSLIGDAPPNPDNSQQGEPNEMLKLVLKAFSKSLKSGDPVVQAIGAAGLAKAMLSRLITDADLLKQLVVTFFDPDSASNAQLRQSLSYFLPVYCHSRADNAARMAAIACAVISRLTTLREARLDEDDADAAATSDSMVSLTQVANMLLDWTDPRKIVGFSDGTADPAQSGTSVVVADTHFILAEALLERLVTAQLSREERKVLLSMLGKLHLPAAAAPASATLTTLLELLVEAVDTGVATDKTGENILAKLRETLMRLVHDAMTLERGGGGSETLLETTDAPRDLEGEDQQDDATEAGEEGGEGSEEHDYEEDVTEQLQREMRDTTVGFTTAMVPDAEGTRIQLLGQDLDGDSEMMDVDE